MARVSLQGISRKFGNVTAIEDISLEIPDREFWVLVGPSGCGKSTVLRTIAGLESISSGQLYIGDRLMNHIPARQRDVAMVFQNYALYPHMSVGENLAFGLKMRGEAQNTIGQRVREVAQSLDIEHLLKRKPKQLSGGQQQRVALGRAIARQPQVFLLDEPLSNLDAQLRDDTRAELKQLHQRVGITTIYVTHDCTEAMTLADRIVVLHEGKIQQIGTPNAIYDRPANSMVASFLGSPPMNILPVTYDGGNLIIFKHGSVRLDEKTLAKLKPSSGEKFYLGVRPEDMIVRDLARERNNADTQKSDRQNCLQLQVSLVEPLGRETLVKAVVADSNLSFNLLTDATWQGAKGDRILAELDPAKIFIFDSQTGNSLITKQS